jgi:hypothetical protein
VSVEFHEPTDSPGTSGPVGEGTPGVVTAWVLLVVDKEPAPLNAAVVSALLAWALSDALWSVAGLFGAPDSPGRNSLLVGAPEREPDFTACGSDALARPLCVLTPSPETAVAPDGVNVLPPLSIVLCVRMLALGLAGTVFGVNGVRWELSADALRTVLAGLPVKLSPRSVLVCPPIAFRLSVAGAKEFPLSGELVGSVWRLSSQLVKVASVVVVVVPL